MRTLMTPNPFQKSLAIAHLILLAAGVTLLAILSFGLLHVNGLIQDTGHRLDETFVNINTLIIQAGVTNTNEQKYLRDLSTQTLLAVKTANASLSDLDGVLREAHQIAAGIDTATLPKINVAIESATRTLPKIDVAIASVTAAVDTSRGVIAKAGPAIDQLTGDAKTADAVLEDLHAILDAPALREIAPNLAGATRHLDGTAAEVEETVGYIRDDFRPTKKNFWHNLTSQIIPEFLRWLIPTPVKISHSPL
jgi:hypothetical protein